MCQSVYEQIHHGTTLRQIQLIHLHLGAHLLLGDLQSLQQNKWIFPLE
jgi:hypothetical protein